MKYSTFIAAAALCLSATTTQAQTPKTMLKANKIINEILISVLRNVQSNK